MKIISLICCLCIAQLTQARQNIKEMSDTLCYTSESFSFIDAIGTDTLTGVLTIPQNVSATTKIAVLVASPLPAPRDYYGLFSTLARILSKKGIATLRFDNRAYTSKSYSIEKENITMFDQVDDVHALLSTLKKDKRFANNPIGLLGHSEGGAVVSIEASRNKNIKFAVCLSPMGIKGVDFAYEQKKMPIDLIKNAQESQQINAYLKDIFNIIYDNISINRMKMLIKQETYKYYDVLKGSKTTVSQISNNIFSSFVNPHTISFIKYDPELYYPYISCPILIMGSKMDGYADCEKNLRGIENILKKSENKNYKVIAVDSVDHAYKKAEQRIPLFIDRISHHSPNYKEPEYAVAVFEQIAQWIKKL